MVVDDAVGLGVALMLPAEEEADEAAALLLLLIPGLMDESLFGDDALLGDALLPM